MRTWNIVEQYRDFASNDARHDFLVENPEWVEYDYTHNGPEAA